MEIFQSLDEVKEYLDRMGYDFVIQKSYINYNRSVDIYGNMTGNYPVTISLSGRLDLKRRKSNVK